MGVVALERWRDEHGLAWNVVAQVGWALWVEVRVM